jgi:signal transduction histidine kinase
MERPVGSAVLVSAALLSVLTVSTEAAHHFYLKEQISYVVRQSAIPFVCDVDLDGNDDVLLADSFQIVWYRIYGYSLVLRDSGTYKNEGFVSNVCDANGDGRPEFFVTMDLPQGLFLACHDWFAKEGPSNPVYELGPYLSRQQRMRSWPRGTLYVMNCFDANGDGQPELYLGVIPYYRKPYPRSLAVYDGQSGKKEFWHQNMGPQLKDVKLLPLPPDSALIVVSTFASANHSVWEGTSDDSSYVFCFDAYGQMKWKIAVTGPGSWSNIEITDGNGDGLKDIYVARKFAYSEVRAGATDRWAVALLDRTTGRILYENDLSAGAEDILAANVNRDQSPELLVSTSDGRLFILKGDLSTSRVSTDTRQKGQGDPCIFDVVDLNGDGTREIVCAGASSVLIRDENGEIIAEQDLGGAVTAAVARVDEKRLVVAKALGQDNIRLFTLDKSPGDIAGGSESSAREPLWKGISSQPQPIGLLLMGAALGVVFSLGAVEFRRRLKRRELRFAVSEEAQDDLLNAMSAFGHGGSSLRILDRLRFHLKNWERMREGAGATDSFQRLVETFNESTLPDLRHLVFLARKARVSPRHWESIVKLAMDGGSRVERLRFASDQPLSSIEKATAEDALKAFNDLDKKISGIRDHLRRAFKTPVVSSLGQILSDREKELQKMGIKAELKVLGSYNEAAFVSPNVFARVIDGLVANGAAAMRDKNPREVHVVVSSEGGNCLVDVRDMGIGIAEVDWERVFERHYTTKEGEGGFGLYYSREELAKFSGKIYVLDSKLGVGTTFRVVLRRSV